MPKDKPEAPRPIPTKKVAAACLEVAKNDLKRVKERPFHMPMAHKQDGFVTTELLSSEQAARIKTCNDRIAHYKELAR